MIYLFVLMQFRTASRFALRPEPAQARGRRTPRARRAG